jgi:hypothetical protein
MNAYGQTSDANRGFLRESWGHGSLTAEITVSSREEYGWQEAIQQIIEISPLPKRMPFSVDESSPALQSGYCCHFFLTPPFTLFGTDRQFRVHSGPRSTVPMSALP